MVRLFDLMKEDMRYVVWKKNKKLFQESAVDATDDDSARFSFVLLHFHWYLYGDG